MFDTTSGHGPANLWQVVWRRKSLLVLGVLAGLGLGLLACSRLAPQYQSSARVLVVKKRPDAVTGVDTRSLAVEDYVATLQELLKGEAVLEQAVRDGKLASLESFAGERGGPTDALRKGLSVSATNKGPSGPNNVLKIAFRGKQPDDCPAVLHAVLTSFKDYLDRQYQSISDDTIELILRDRDALQKELAQKEADYLKFRETSPVLGKGRNGLDLRQERLNNIQTKRSALLLRRVEVEGQLAAVEAALKAGRNRDAVLAMLIEFAARGDTDESPRPRSLAVQDELGKLLIEERKLLDLHGPKHPELKSVRHRIEAARRLLVLPPSAWGNDAAAKDPVEIHLALLRQKFDQYRVAEANLDAVFQREQAEARKLAGDEIRDESFQTQIALTKQLVEGLVKRLREVSLIKGVGGFEVQVLEPPAPAVKASPNVPLIVTLATLLGGLAGFAAAFLAGATDRRFRTTDEVRQGLGLAVVGSIPAFKPPGKRALARLAAGLPGLDPMLCTYYSGASAETEAFRGLRNALCFGARGGPRVVEVTGPQGGEGKSTVAANLAVSAAQSGRKVLLIDADLRRPVAHRLFGVPAAAAGLAQVLAGDAAPPEVIRDSGIPRLAVLPAGAATSNPAELLTSPLLKELLDGARERYDLVVIDTPALLPVTDAGAVARQADGVLLVLHATKTDKPHARRACEVLEAAGAKLLGVVVNAARRSADPLGYGRTAAAFPAAAVHGPSQTP